MKRCLRVLICTLLASCLCLSCMAVACAQSSWRSTIMEQCRIIAPQVSVVLYPVDSNHEIIYGFNESNTTVTASLDGEPLEFCSLERAESMSCLYMVVLNLSVNKIEYSHLQLVKQDLTDWIDSLKENDRFLLVTYGAEPSLLLDGSESRSAAKKMIDGLEQDLGSVDAVKALEEAIRFSAQPENTELERRVLVMIDSGLLASESGNQLQSLQAQLLAEGLPLYTLCTSPYESVHVTLSQLSGPTGGGCISVNSGHATGIPYLRTRLSNGYVLRFEGKSNQPLPKDRILHLNIALQGEAAESMDFSVHVSGSIPDEEAPTAALAFAENGTALTLRYTEAVTGAEHLENYGLSNAKNGKNIELDSVTYDAESYTATLNFRETLPDGNYELRLENITDCSAEANPICYPDGETCFVLTLGEGAGFPLWLALVLGTLVLLAVVAVVLVALKLRKSSETAEPMLPVQLTILTRDGQKFYHQINVGKSFTMGRSAEKSNLALQGDPQISRCHLQLSYDGKALTAVDIGSQNGSMVNGVVMEKQRLLNSGDTITLGHTQISVMF